MLELSQLILVHRHGQRTSYLPFLDQHTQLDKMPLCTQSVALDELKQSSLFGSLFSVSFGLRSLPNIKFELLDAPDAQIRDAFSSESLVQVDGPLPGGRCHPGQLTDKGKLNLRTLGKSLRNSYSDFLDSVSDDSTHFRSTHYTRTVESLQYLMSGLRPNQKEMLVKIQLDESLQPQINSHCKALQRLVVPFQEAALSRHAKTALELNKHVDRLFPGVQHQENNHPMATILDRGEFAPLNKFFDAFSCWKGNGVGVFSHDHDDDVLREAAHRVLDAKTIVANELLFASFRDAGKIHPQVYKLGMGRFWNEIRGVLDDNGRSLSTSSSSRSSTGTKLAVFSGHDTTLAPLLSSLGVFEGELGQWPGFASYVAFEVYTDQPSQDSKDQSTKEYIRVKYNGQAVELPMCKSNRGAFGLFKSGKTASPLDPTLCPLDTFLEGIKKMIPNDYHSECK